jgi:hypothetical protein
MMRGRNDKIIRASYLKLFGFFICLSLAFIFPLFAYEMNSDTFGEIVLSTSVGTIAISLLLK